MEELVRLTYARALEEVKTTPISRPQIQPGTYLPNEAFSYTALFEIKPELTLDGYKGLKLEKEEVVITPKEIDEELKKIQQSMTQLAPTADETVLGEGHVATLDFKGKAGGKPFKGSEAKDFQVDIGTGGILPEFEKQLHGLKKGEVKQIEFQYPKDYFNKELADQKAEFTVTLKDLRAKNVPALNDDFAKDLGNYESLAQVREAITTRLAQTKENAVKGALFQKILKELSEKNKFDIPESMVNTELSHMVEQLGHEMTQRGQKLEDLNLQEVVNHYRPEAEFRTRGFLILDKIAQLEKLEVADAEIDQFLEAQSKAAGRPKEQIRAYYEKNQLFNSLKMRLLHEKALEFVLSQAKIKGVKPKKKD